MKEVSHIVVFGPSIKSLSPVRRSQTRGNLDNSRRVMDSAREVLDMAGDLNGAVSRLSA